jgi:hypothetical protein
MAHDEGNDLVSYNIGGKCTVGIERALCPTLQMKLRHWDQGAHRNDLVIRKGHPLKIHESLSDKLTFVNDGYRPIIVAMRPTADEMLVKKGSYEIVRQGGIFVISPEGITCHGVVHDTFIEHSLLRPSINSLLVPKGMILAHGGAVSIEGKVLLFLGESGKTSLTLELLSRGARFMADEYSILDSDGMCTMYSPYMWIDGRHFIFHPELLETSYPDPKQRKKVEKNISFFRMGYQSFRGNNFLSRQAREMMMSKTYFEGLTCRFDQPFPKAELEESGKIAHVFHLESRQTDDLITSATAQDIAGVESAALWIRQGYHAVLAGLAGIPHISYEETRTTFENSLSKAECHSVGVKLRAERSQEDFRKIVDAMLDMV